MFVVIQAITQMSRTQYKKKLYFFMYA